MVGQPAVAEAFAAAEQDPTLLPDAIARRLAAQEALGMKPEDRRVLTKSEATELMQSLQALPLEQQAAAVAELRDTYGTHSGRLAAELEEAGLPRLLALVLDPSSGPALAHRFVTLLNPDGPESLRDLPESGITSETTKQFLPEGEAGSSPPRPRLKPIDGTSASDSTAIPIDDPDVMPPAPQRKPGSTLNPSEKRLLENYQLVMEADEATLTEGLDASWVAALEAFVESKAEEHGIRPEIAELTRRLALRNLRSGGGLESATTAALIETGVEQLNLSLDTSRYMPRLTGDPIADAEAYMDRLEIERRRIPPDVAETLLEILVDAGNIRSIEREQGQQGLLEFHQRVVNFNSHESLSFHDWQLGYAIVRKAGKAVETPYEHRWSLNDAELGTTIVFLARKIEESATNSLWKSFILFLLDAVPFSKWGGAALSGMKRTLDAVGIIENLDDEKASNILLDLVLEAIHRGHFVYDVRKLMGLGLN